jgi:aerotaxis receptor
MRSNTPVTNVEYILGEAETIVSKTDLKGNITYINEIFIKISGFSEAELIGAPQNIVRHPDMPREAFEDFWRTLKAGRAWTGLVKNRCKNGDHYWVVANAAPYMENGRIAGYTSIRVKPSRLQVEAAQRDYKRIQQGEKSLIVRDGSVIPRPGVMQMDWLRGSSLELKFNLLIIMIGIFILAALVMAFTDSQKTSGLNSGAGLFLAGIGLYFLRDAAITPLISIRQHIKQMSSGDLTGNIKAKGSREASEALQALRILQINFKLLVGQIKEASGIVNDGAMEIASGNADLSARTESQASSLEETASAMEELTGTVTQNAENAHEANELVLAATKVAGAGGDAVNAVVRKMTAIKQSSVKISEIISVIDSIAFQTNILALNAAVEAARAGEQGRGFAVVASEVRNLAHRSAAAAKEIKGLITESVSQVDSGSELVIEAGRIISEVVESVKQIEQYVGGISISSKEQSQGIVQVNQAIICLGSWDHVPIRSWPLFKARQVLRTLLTNDNPLPIS